MKWLITLFSRSSRIKYRFGLAKIWKEQRIHCMMAINAIVITVSFNENEMAYLILPYIVNNCLKSAFKPFKIAFKIDLSMSIPSSSIWNIVICRKDVEQLSKRVALTKFFLLYFSLKCQLSLKKLDYSMLPSIRPVPVSGLLKKDSIFAAPFLVFGKRSISNGSWTQVGLLLEKLLQKALFCSGE